MSKKEHAHSVPETVEKILHRTSTDYGVPAPSFPPPRFNKPGEMQQQRSRPGKDEALPRSTRVKRFVEAHPQ